MSKNRIITPAPPNLPLGTDTYERRYQDQFTNILRLYFNQLQNAFSELFGPDGGKYIAFPHIAASDAALQYATAANTPTIVQWTSLDAGTGFTLNANNTATAQVPGIYKITYSLQFANNDNAAHDAFVWLRIDGSIPLTTCQIQQLFLPYNREKALVFQTMSAVIPKSCLL